MDRVVGVVGIETKSIGDSEGGRNDNGNNRQRGELGNTNNGDAVEDVGETNSAEDSPTVFIVYWGKS